MAKKVQQPRVQFSLLTLENDPTIKMARRIAALSDDGLIDTADWLREYATQHNGLDGHEEITKAFTTLAQWIDKIRVGR